MYIHLILDLKEESFHSRTKILLNFTFNKFMFMIHKNKQTQLSAEILHYQLCDIEIEHYILYASSLYAGVYLSLGSTEDQFRNHMDNHFEHQCPHCDYKSRTEGRLKRHIKGTSPFCHNNLMVPPCVSLHAITILLQVKCRVHDKVFMSEIN